MFRIIMVLILAAFPSLALAGNIDLMWEQSNDYGVKSYTKGIDFTDKTGVTEIKGSYRYGKTDGIVSQDKGELGIDYNPSINDRWSVWLDESVSYDKVIGIDFENNLGFGLKYYVYKGKDEADEDIKLSVSGGLLYQFTSWGCDDPETCYQEGTGRYSYRAKFSKHKLLFVYSYQPNINDPSDYIAKIKSEVKLVEIDKGIALVWRYDSEFWSLYGQAETHGLKLRFRY
jgi:hypothetical protein